MGWDIYVHPMDSSGGFAVSLKLKTSSDLGNVTKWTIALFFKFEGEDQNLEPSLYEEHDFRNPDTDIWFNGCWYPDYLNDKFIIIVFPSLYYVEPNELERCFLELQSLGRQLYYATLFDDEYKRLGLNKNGTKV